MDQRLSLVTLGVVDLAVSRRFYEAGLGWRASSASVDDAVFFDAGGVVLALYPRHLLAADAEVPAEGQGFGGIVLAHNVSSRAEVDATLDAAARAGAAITKAATEAFWGGYSGYFRDPDGHAWEVAHNPGWPLDDQGRIVLPG